MSFPQMVTIVPEGELGVAAIRHADVSVFDSKMSAIRGVRLNPGPIAMLYVGGKLMMSDGANEHMTNAEVCIEARGHVLIAGLGLGMILTRILAEPTVESVTVIEKYPDVIALVGPHIAHEKLTIIPGDIYEWTPAKGTKYDCIYFDIWAEQSTDELKDMKALHDRFRRFKAKGGWMDSWNRKSLQARKRRGGW